MLNAALGLLAGIALLHALPALPAAPVTLAAALTGLVLLACRPARFLAFAGLGLALASWQAGERLADDWPCARDREVRVVAGSVDSLPESTRERAEFEFATSADSRADGVPSHVRVSWYEPGRAPQPGETWRLPLRLRCRHSLLNPGGGDRELALLRDGVGATAYVTRDGAPERLSRGPAGPAIDRARAWIAHRIGEATRGSGSTGVLQGLAVGARGGIPEQRWRTLKTTGIAHLVAISGLHVTAFALVAVTMLRRSYRLPWPVAASRRRVGLEAACMLSAAGGYTLLAGAGLPAIRTLLMLAVALLLRASRRQLLPARVLGAALALMLVADPLSVSSAGLWLSFVAVAALLASDRAAGQGAVLGFARAQAAVTIALTPVVASVFGLVSLASPVANAVAIPAFSTVILPATLLGVALLPIAPQAAERVFSVLAQLLDACWPALDALAALPLAAWYPASPPAWLLAVGGAAAASILLLPLQGLRLAAVAVLAAMLAGGQASVPIGAVDVAVLDVGHGLAVVARTHDHALLFDTGPAWRGGGSAADSVVLPFLHAAGIRRLDAVVLSHGDADHAGGWPAVVASLPVAEAWKGPGLAHVRAAPCLRGRSWSWDGVSFEFLHPGPGEDWSENNGSCVMLVRAGTRRVLLAADVEREAEDVLVRDAVHADVVLVPHHGSRSSSSPAFVAAADARYALVSAGFGNRWGLPRPEVVERWRDAGAELLTTADAGAIQLRMDAQRDALLIERFRERSRRWWRPGEAQPDSGKGGR